MDKRALLFIEESFLKPLLEMDDITDISYNGKDIYYFHNQLGRQKSDIKISNDDAKAFLRHLANITEQQFSYSSPYLDISLGKYRLNATFNSIARMNNEKVFTFSSYILYKLSGLESLLLQGFTKEFVMKATHITNSKLLAQTGNAMTVNVIRAIGESLLNYIKEDTVNGFGAKRFSNC